MKKMTRVVIKLAQTIPVFVFIYILNHMVQHMLNLQHFNIMIYEKVDQNKERL